MIIAGNGIYERCGDCGKLVKMNKWCGGLHFCLSPEEIAYKRHLQTQARQQLNYRPMQVLGSLGGMDYWPTQAQPTNKSEDGK